MKVSLNVNRGSYLAKHNGRKFKVVQILANRFLCIDVDGALCDISVHEAKIKPKHLKKIFPFLNRKIDRILLHNNIFELLPYIFVYYNHQHNEFKISDERGQTKVEYFIPNEVKNLTDLMDFVINEVRN